MTDLAHLELRISSTQVPEAEARLDELAKTGANVESVFGEIETVTGRAAESIDAFRTSAAGVTAEVAQAERATAELSLNFEDTATAASDAASVISEFTSGAAIDLDFLSQRTDVVVATFGEIREEVGVASSSVAGYADAARAAASASEEFADEGQQAAGASRELAGDVGRLKSQVVGFVTALVGLQAARKVGGTLLEVERGLVGVAKTADLSDAELSTLEERFKSTSVSLRTPITRLLELAGAAGQVGVSGVEDLSRFSETISEFERAASDIGGEEAVVALARLLNLSGEGAGEIDVLTSSIVRLGNETSATEREIIDTATAVGASLATYRLASTTIAGLSAAIVNAGQDAEAGSSVLGQTFSAIDQAVSAGGARLEQFAAIAGVSADAFAAAFSADRVAGFQAFVEGLGRVTETQNITSVLQSVGLEGIRTERVLGALAANSEILGDSLALVESELQSGTARTDEFRRGIDTLGGSLDGLKAAAIAAVDEGLDEDTGLAGGLRAVVDTGTEAIQVLAGIVPPTEEVGLASRTAAAGLRLVALSIAAVGVGSAARGLVAARTALLGIATPARVAVAAVGALTGTFGDLSDAVVATGVAYAALRFAPLLAGLTATGAAAATTGVFMGGMAGATLRASVAFGALKTAALANPLTAVLVAGAALIPILSSFGDEAEEAAEAQARLNAEADKFAPIVERMARAQAELSAARASGDRNSELAALQEQIRLTEELAREAELAEFGGDRTVAVRLAAFGPEAVAAVVSELESELLRRVDSSDAPDEIASVLAERIGAGFSSRQSAVLAGLGGLLDVAQQEALASLPEVERAAEEARGALATIERGGSPETLTAAYEDLRDALRSVADAAAFTAPTEAVVDAVEKRITDLEVRASALRDSPTGPAFTEDELGAQAKLTALEESLRVERELASISDTGEADIQRNLREAESLASLTGLSDEARAARLASIEALIRETTALEAARAAREREQDARQAAAGELDAFVAGLAAETSALSLSSDERELAAAREEALALARAAGIEDTATLLATVDAEVKARQDLRASLQAEEDARRDAARAAEDQSETAARALAGLRTDADRQIAGLLNQFGQLDQAIIEQRAALGSGAGIAQANSALAEYERQIASTVEALQSRRDAEVAAAQTTEQAAEAVRRFEADLALAQGSAAGFADRLFELSQIRALGTLATEAARLDEEFASLMRTDRENRIAESLHESERAAADLFAVLEQRRGLGLIDQEQFEAGARSLDSMVGSARDAAIELEKLRQIRGISNDLAEGFGEVARGVAEGTTGLRDAGLELLNVVRSTAIEAIIVEPLKEGLRSAFTEAGAALTGVQTGVALEAAAVTAGGTFTSSVTAATGIFTSGVAVAGESLIAAATTAASILAAQQAAGAATSAVAGVAGAAGGAVPGVSPSPSPSPLPVSGLAESPFAVGDIGRRRRVESQFAPPPSELSGPVGGRTIRSGRAGGDIVFNVQTQNASSFEKSRAQMERDAARSQRRLGRR